ncbi:MAG TPA: spherulation-specific family 4 protein [Pseudonocardiaceae bacterium]|jgi:hypothetical protein|nr:spherulation-specific family 4 protein [Pseudonocardiaceae bacterium]
MTALVVPAYFDPAAAPDDWAVLLTTTDSLRLVVLDPADGPGERCDQAIAAAVVSARAAGVAVAGRVDTDHGARPPSAALVDVAHYWTWYGIDNVLFDRVATDVADIRYYRTLARSARLLGARSVAFHHGDHPAPEYAEHADLLGTFDGTWSAYRDLEVPGWVHDCPADLFYHLVHGVPVGEGRMVGMLAEARNVGAVHHTDRTGPRPWAAVPSDFGVAVDARRSG